MSASKNLRNRPAPEIKPPSAPLKKLLRQDLPAIKALRSVPGGREYIREGLRFWTYTGLLVAGAVPWPALPNSAIASLTLGEEPSWDAAFEPLLMLPLWPRRRDTLVSAYLARCAQRNRIGWLQIVDEMAQVWVWIFARDEFHRRMMGHPLGALLWIITASTTEGEPTWAVPVIKEVERRTTSERIRRTARGGLSLSVANPDPGQRLGEGLTFTPPLKRGVLGQGKVHGLTGEEDPSVAAEEALGLLGVRLAENVRRFRERSIADVATDAMSGRLNFHKKEAKQAVLRGRRPKRERHVLAADPLDERKEPEVNAHDVASVWGGPAESDPVHEAEAAADVERVIATVKRAFRLTRSEAKIVSYVVSHPKSHTLTHGEIAEGANVSLRTFYNTINKLAGDEATLYRIFPHSIFPRQ